VAHFNLALLLAYLHSDLQSIKISQCCKALEGGKRTGNPCT